VKESFSLSAEFNECGNARIIFSDGNTQKLVEFIDDSCDPYYCEGCKNYCVGLLVDVGISLMEIPDGKYSCYTEYATMPNFVDFEGSINSDVVWY